MIDIFTKIIVEMPKFPVPKGKNGLTNGQRAAKEFEEAEQRRAEEILNGYNELAEYNRKSNEGPMPVPFSFNPRVAAYSLTPAAAAAAAARDAAPAGNLGGTSELVPFNNSAAQPPAFVPIAANMNFRPLPTPTPSAGGGTAGGTSGGGAAYLPRSLLTTPQPSAGGAASRKMYGGYKKSKSKSKKSKSKKSKSKKSKSKPTRRN